MSENQNVNNSVGYGYASDEVKISPFQFGLNANVTKLTKFEWIPNGGKDGAPQEAIDIIFTINGVERSYRVFPIVKAFGKDNVEITDPTAPEFKDAVVDLNARITHILHCFIELDAIKVGFGRPINSFKEYAQIAMSLLPKDYKDRPLDIFLQYQWQVSTGQDKTYLEIPGKMKYGRWLSPAFPGTWTEKGVENPSDSVPKALWYENEKGEIHPFVKNGWFMNSNFARQQKVGGNATSNAGNTSAGTQAATQTQADGEAKASAW